MPFNIEDPDADRLARALAQRTGETLTETVIKALSERELRKEQSIKSLIEDVMEIGRHCAALPLLDPRRPDEILGYDTNGGRPTAVDIISWSARWLGTCKCVIWTTI